MKISIKNFIIPSVPLAVFLLGCCVALWALNYFSIDVNQTILQGKTSFVSLNHFFASHLFLSNLLSIILTFLNGFLLIQLNTKFSLIRTRTFLPVLIYVLLMAVWSLAKISLVNHFTLTLLIVALFIFMSMYNNKKAVEQAFSGSLIIGIGSFFSFELIFLLPTFWIGFIMFKSMSLRTFLASVFGAITPLIIFFSVKFYFHPEINWFDGIAIFFDTTVIFKTYSIEFIVYIALLIILLLIGLTVFLNNLHNDSIQTRQRVKLFVVLFFSALFITLFFSAYNIALLPLIALCYAMIFSHPLSLQNNNFNSIIFIVFCLVNIIYVFMNYYFSI